jgi:hypothetical protein
MARTDNKRKRLRKVAGRELAKMRQRAEDHELQQKKDRVDSLMKQAQEAKAKLAAKNVSSPFFLR